VFSVVKETLVNAKAGADASLETKMKTIFALILVLALVGCGNDGATTTKEAAPSSGTGAVGEAKEEQGDIVGTWKNTTDEVSQFTFSADGKAEMRITDGKKAAIWTGTYTYNAPKLIIELKDLKFENHSAAEEAKFRKVFKSEQKREYDVTWKAGRATLQRKDEIPQELERAG
jgi:hypothetical protein